MLLRVLILTFCLTWACPSWADIPAIAPAIRLCATEWPPFTIKEGDNITSGISIDAIHEAFRRLGLNYQIRALSWILCRREVAEDRMDGLIDATPAESQLGGPNFTSVYPLAIFVVDDSEMKTYDPAELSGEQVGMVRGYGYGPVISNHKEWKRVDADSDEQLMVWLKLRRIRYVVTDIFAGPLLAQRVGAKVRYLTPLIDASPLYLSFVPKQAELAARYNKVIGDMIDDGTLDAIYRRYLPYDFHEAMKRWLAKDPRHP